MLDPVDPPTSDISGYKHIIESETGAVRGAQGGGADGAPAGGVLEGPAGG